MLTKTQYYNLDQAFEKLMKALTDDAKIVREQNILLDKNYRIMHPVIVKWMEFTRTNILKALNKKYINKSFQKTEVSRIVAKLTDWGELEKDGIRMVKPAAMEIYEKGGNEAFKIAGIEGSFDIVNINAVNKVNEICSKLIVEVNGNTKKAINTLIKTGIAEGQSVGKIAKQIRPLIGLTERQSLAVGNYRGKLLKKYPKYTTAKLDKMAKRYSDKLHRYRADMIARTETARAQSEGTLQGYNQLGYKKVEWSANVNACPICDALEGHRFTLEEASGMMPAHPMGRCAWIPVREEGVRPKVPRLDRLRLSNANAEQLRGEMKLNNMMFDSTNNLESAAMTKQRIIKELAEKLKDNKEFMKYVKSRHLTEALSEKENMEGIINHLIKDWAGTSGDANTHAIAMQMAAKAEFGLTNVAIGHLPTAEALKLLKIEGKAMQAFLRAQYNLTQEYFKKQGITSLTSYRGMKLREKIPGYKFGGEYVMTSGDLQLQPLSSFSINVDTAREFAGMGNQMVIQSNVPISRILSTCQTGFGCKSEAELVILGGKESFRIVTGRAVAMHMDAVSPLFVNLK